MSTSNPTTPNKPEHQIQNEIRLALSQAGHTAFRINVGKFLLQDGRWFDVGAPKGFSDVVGFRADGQIFFIEVKNAKGRPSKEQLHFIEMVKSKGALAGIARSAKEALEIVNGGK
ncbi:MAG: VRR-NUC domain-containing protein [Turicibacter sp.]|nr:VRR-NUC domain-containing protein [Turicibacter sp.]